MLGVTGGIAAYKAAALSSGCAAGRGRAGDHDGSGDQIRRAADVPDAVAQSGRDGHLRRAGPVGRAHIDLADAADLFVVAPATANIIGKMARGLADDMLTTTLLATTAPISWRPP